MKNKVAGKNFEPIKFNFYYWPLLNFFFFQLTKNSSGMKKNLPGGLKVRMSTFGSNSQVPVYILFVHCAIMKTHVDKKKSSNYPKHWPIISRYIASRNIATGHCSHHRSYSHCPPEACELQIPKYRAKNFDPTRIQNRVTLPASGAHHSTKMTICHVCRRKLVIMKFCLDSSISRLCYVKVLSSENTPYIF